MVALDLPGPARQAIATYTETVTEHRQLGLYQTLLVWAGDRDGARVEWASVEVEFEELPAALAPYQEVVDTLDLEWTRDLATVSDFEMLMGCPKPEPDSHYAVWHIARDSGRLAEYWSEINGPDTPEVGYFFDYPNDAVAAAKTHETLGKDERVQMYIEHDVEPRVAGTAEYLVPYAPAPTWQALQTYLETGGSWFDTLHTLATTNNLSTMQETLTRKRDERIPDVFQQF